MNREQKAALLISFSGHPTHSSDCATSVAPAEEPSPCDCHADGARNTADTLLEQRDKLTAMLDKCVERLKRELVTYEYGAPVLDALITEAESLLAEVRGGR